MRVFGGMYIDINPTLIDRYFILMLKNIIALLVYANPKKGEILFC